MSKHGFEGRKEYNNRHKFVEEREGRQATHPDCRGLEMKKSIVTSLAYRGFELGGREEKATDKVLAKF